MSANTPCDVSMVAVDHSIEALPPKSRIRQIYPEDIFPNGSYAPLPYGRVRYWILGPEDGIKVVLIHGISTPSISWKEVAPYLAAQDFRVLVYDLYGKGYSEAPKTVYDAALFVTQLALLLQFVRWNSAHVVGYSMGGGITAAFASSLPHLVEGKIVFISSAGLLERTTSRKNRDAGFEQFRQLQASSLPGYKRSLQSCFDNGPIRGMQDTFDKLSSLAVGPKGSPLKALIIHGTDDEVVPCTEADKIKARIPHAEVLKIEGARHDVVSCSPHWEALAEALAAFLR